MTSLTLVLLLFGLWLLIMLLMWYGFRRENKMYKLKTKHMRSEETVVFREDIDFDKLEEKIDTDIDWNELGFEFSERPYVKLNN